MAQKYDLYNLGASSEQPPLDSRHLIEVKKASNKGRGIFAKAALPRGTRVVAESPLLSPNTQGSLRTPINLEQLFQALPEDKQSAYVQLYGDAGDFVKQIVDEDFETELGRKLSAIYYLNRIEDDLLWLGSIFNHSCIPNICYTHNAATKKYTFQTIHAVEAGEELTISYLGGVIESREKRQDEFGRQWNFHCLCQACTDDAKEQQLVDLILLWKKHEADVKNRQSYKERLPTLQSLARLTLSSGLVGAELSTW
ncbi:SET domain-containing protein [Microthyrium microscopicum]|uniref:SET domain-containing protein n=1 Tax=Microthyrium microscopicum TaxID=703497 RepID=A0A6A6TW96_9PEZI|nr:SET domain-containing protein [Microthyrium microscopicum]